ncbi:MAG: glyoxylate-induced protein, partial [Lachnospiraceae bacterium]|nr:glyoxylate-induced protein [Lachnospiraceae bacterium]
ACIPLLTDAGITLVYEPLNTKVNHKGYFLYSSDEALFVAEQVDSPSVKILFDFYQQIMEGERIRDSSQTL